MTGGWRLLPSSASYTMALGPSSVPSGGRAQALAGASVYALTTNLAVSVVTLIVSVVLATLLVMSRRFASI